MVETQTVYTFANAMIAAVHQRVPSQDYIEMPDGGTYRQGETVQIVSTLEEGFGALHERPSWDEYFLKMAQTASERADCRRRRVGVIVTQDNRIVGHGYNGTAPGAPGCLEGACPRGLKSYDEKPPLSDYSDCISRHGEVNALWNTSADEREGSTVYVTDEPCAQCRTVMQSMGVARVVWPEGELNW